jgi:prolyl-tRNA editing enzyme YbaK/EbsC (Cys-tRNA(Pro) deacylase)
MKFGTLEFVNVVNSSILVASSTKTMIERLDSSEVYGSAIDAGLSDTAAFCEQYQIGMEQGANCVIVEAKRAERVWHVACVVLGTDKVDVNGAVRKYLGAKKASFAAMDIATSLTVMEYGGITPVGLPADWPILIDSAVAAADWLIIGSGVRSSKLLVPGQFLGTLPNATTIDITKIV